MLFCVFAVGRQHKQLDISIPRSSKYGKIESINPDTPGIKLKND